MDGVTALGTAVVMAGEDSDPPEVVGEVGSRGPKILVTIAARKGIGLGSANEANCCVTNVYTRWIVSGSRTAYSASPEACRRSHRRRRKTEVRTRAVCRLETGVGF